MNPTHVIAADLARVFPSATARDPVSVLVWGDPVEVITVASDHVELLLPDLGLGRRAPGFIKTARDVVTPIADNKVLKVDFVDVQQGDACTIETPRGKVMLIDGGDNQLFARHLAGRFRGTSAANPLPVECILVTHGDADHFLGLTKILESETHATEAKRIFIQPRRVYHNGLVKRPSRVREAEQLGAITVVDGETIITGLEQDLLAVADAQMNEPFRAWKAALATWHGRAPLRCDRLGFGDDGATRFPFLTDEGIHAEILGPIPTTAGGVTGLHFLRQPPKGPRAGHESLETERPRRGALSASHTINGHSIVLRVTYGDIHFLFTGDLNDEAGRALTRAHNRGELSLRSEVLKVPHHGSADFSGALLQAVAPVASIVSSGDESARKEYIHPRATLMGALGRWSRVDEPLIFCTELVAFFSVVGPATDGQGKSFFGFSRTDYGLVKARTDGQRLLFCTNSGLTTMKEAYAYSLDGIGQPVPSAIRQV